MKKTKDSIALPIFFFDVVNEIAALKREMSELSESNLDESPDTIVYMSLLNERDSWRKRVRDYKELKSLQALNESEVQS